MLDKYNQIIKVQQDASIIEEVLKFNIPTAGKNILYASSVRCSRG